MNPVKNNLVALGSAAVLTVYAAGFFRTKSAADRFDGEDADRRQAVATSEHVPDSTSRLSLDAPAVVTANAKPAQSPAPRVPSPAPSAVRPTSTAGRGDSSKPVAASHTGVTSSATAAARQLDSIAPATVMANTTTAAPPTGLQGTTTGAQVADSQPTPNPRGQFKDGSYSGWGTSRHGDIQATVEIRDGHIISATISQCLTRYSCSWISALPGQVVSRQSANVDFVSGATQSTNAFYYAIVEALAKAK